MCPHEIYISLEKTKANMVTNYNMMYIGDK